MHLGLHCQQIGKRRARFVEDRVPGVREAVLRQIADGQRRRLDNAAAVGLVEPREHFQQRGFAGAVRAAQADALAASRSAR